MRRAGQRGSDAAANAKNAPLATQERVFCCRQILAGVLRTSNFGWQVIWIPKDL